MSTSPGGHRRSHVRALISSDAAGGVLLLAATLLALLAANGPVSGLYESVRGYPFGPAVLHLRLSVEAWAADGLLAVFFFVVGLELKQEFALGSLRDPRRAVLPITAAVGGVALPALLYLAVAGPAGPDAARGWAVPAATDIAFAVAVLSVVGRRLPAALRAFLLTLAVVDDLIAISIIAIGYTAGLAPLLLACAVVPLVVFGLLVRRGVRAWWLLIPLGLLTWGLVHASGVHATIAGVALGLVVPATVSRGGKAGGEGAGSPVTERFAHRWRPWSSLVAVPVFAFLAAGVPIGGLDGLAAAVVDPVAVGIVVALVSGKSLGISLTTFAVSRLPGVRLDPAIRWPDLIGLSFVAGIGFTVSLLIAGLAFGDSSTANDHARIAVLAGSTLSALIGATVLGVRGRGRARIDPAR